MVLYECGDMSVQNGAEERGGKGQGRQAKEEKGREGKGGDHTT